MKGIIIYYNENKGFGFIKDGNEEEIFFHLTNINDKDTFLNNIGDYYYTDWDERKCFVVNFDPSQNNKGLIATNIDLTQQVFNDKSTTVEFEAKVTDFRREDISLTRISTGIKKGKSRPFGATAGGNGTYRMGYPEMTRKLNIYFRRIDDIGWGTIDVRDLALSINNRSKISNVFVQTVKNLVVGKTIKVISSRTKWNLKNNTFLKI